MRSRMPFSREDLMEQWMLQHGEAHEGKHWKGSIHRRYARARHSHRCGSTCDKRDPMNALKKAELDRKPKF